MFEGWGLLFNFFYSVMFGTGFALILLIIRLVLHLRKKPSMLTSNFFYVLSGIFNLNIFIIWVICLILDILEIENGFLAIFMSASLLMAGFIFFDIYKSNFKLQGDEKSAAKP
ncbi:hypothetical protein HYN49_10250 [Flavobacterium pallidum]|uniref:Uncharacterized protein n=1 Tax=Flavobacterium pallidum TaxID=2172098 RepID=A0A2S1SIM3_9FLAO|nr:hypothetical protein HYN49_10250 [Flavobacterium pallidum]